MMYWTLSYKIVVSSNLLQLFITRQIPNNIIIDINSVAQVTTIMLKISIYIKYTGVNGIYFFLLILYENAHRIVLWIE